MLRSRDLSMSIEVGKLEPGHRLEDSGIAAMDRMWAKTAGLLVEVVTAVVDNN